MKLKSACWLTNRDDSPHRPTGCVWQNRQQQHSRGECQSYSCLPQVSICVSSSVVVFLYVSTCAVRKGLCLIMKRKSALCFALKALCLRHIPTMQPRIQRPLRGVCCSGATKQTLSVPREWVGNHSTHYTTSLLSSAAVCQHYCISPCKPPISLAGS